MRIISTSVYYYEKFGYIITSDTMVKGLPIHTVVNPVITKEPQITKETLGEAIKEGLEKSLNSELVDNSQLNKYKFWQVSKIKGFSAFSKKFRQIEIKQDGDYYEIQEWERDVDGSYVEPMDDSKKIRVTIDTSFDIIADIVLNCFSDIKDKTYVCISFKTLENRTVTFTRPSEDFISVGDGNTDAYQIFVYNEDNKNYIAFLIDNGYLEYKEEAIKARWSKIYGDLSEFLFKEVNNNLLKIKVYAKTKNKTIISNIYQDGNGMLEVISEIDMTNISKDIYQKIKQEFENVTASIKIV